MAALDVLRAPHFGRPDLDVELACGGLKVLIHLCGTGQLGVPQVGHAGHFRHLGAGARQPGGELGYALGPAVAVSIVDGDVDSLHIAFLAQALLKGCDQVRRGRRRAWHEQTDAVRLCRLLGMNAARPGEEHSGRDHECSHRHHASGRMCGKRMTSRMLGLSVRSITRRSMPRPAPAAGRQAVFERADVVGVVVHRLLVARLLQARLLEEARRLVLGIVQLGEAVGDLLRVDEQLEAVGELRVGVVAGARAATPPPGSR